MMMTVIVREVVDGWLIAMNDEVGKRAAPGAVFRMGRMSTDGRHPVVETLQPGWSSGTQYFMPFRDEAEVREFLLGLGFTELPRWTPGAPPLSFEAPH
ncbi:hypothetical protein KDX27_35035 [Burkholderia cenocepacia]|nr:MULTISPECIES: hypothetical protein [Burkholderia cepacia complex]MBH9724830.1 hypothetical protein [Burkholderia contaminans]MBR8029217.1 hypothetical protein [Burkholderia cenocepacia]MBR8094189.1 hypothetical protein [Burkholderia cenocepacia]MBR8172945.1 hypothetical protein [Burkholderia cenocepacia]MBY4710673.1 hypothetical protein [Burkholderia cepacia]